MKKKGILITTIIFFILVNTSYFWNMKLGLYAFPFFLLIFLVFIVLVIISIKQIYLGIKEKFNKKSRNINVGILVFVITTTLLWPTGIIDFKKFESETIFFATSEGAANCSTSLKLKKDFTFKQAFALAQQKSPESIIS